MSIVEDRRCDGCGKIKPGPDDEWWALIPPGWDGEDGRLDFCNVKCVARWVAGTPLMGGARTQVRVNT